ncbi:hypothetical protein LU293_03195 [Moraxella nasovis]|uniref:hypothetical protein n=1 Tax=Moraxella nasovis TaxID=2904121 RepID=UPI001F60142C|nr:hypothetical protein [Moraxella nasovis]UNU73921.1 hypothetical protein LU293_03195 [Moraxella nasovis]
MKNDNTKPIKPLLHRADSLLFATGADIVDSSLPDLTFGAIAVYSKANPAQINQLLKQMLG